MVGMRESSADAFRENVYLRSLKPGDAALLSPMMTLARFRLGQQLGLDEQGEPLICFPISLVAFVGNGSARGGRGLIGHEGLIGWPTLLGLAPSELDAIALFDGGTALVLPIKRMQIACFASPTLAMSLLRFVQTYTVQLANMLENSACTTLTQRLSAWLLMLHDRIDGDFISLTHQTLAGHLGVRRASVTDSLHLLEGERAVRCDRAIIQVRDRQLLERCASRAYGRTEEIYRRSIGPFGKGAKWGPFQSPSSIKRSSSIRSALAAAG